MSVPGPFVCSVDRPSHQLLCSQPHLHAFFIMLAVWSHARGFWRRSLCSYTHPALAPEGSDASAATALPRFPNLKELRRHLSERLQLHFCPVCLEGRKVRAA